MLPLNERLIHEIRPHFVKGESSVNRRDRLVSLKEAKA